MLTFLLTELPRSRQDFQQGWQGDQGDQQANKQTGSCQQAKLGNRTIIHFKISANVRAPGASS